MCGSFRVTVVASFAAPDALLPSCVCPAAASADVIRDHLEEVVVLRDVHALVAEWIPFGSNQIVSLNEVWPSFRSSPC